MECWFFMGVDSSCVGLILPTIPRPLLATGHSRPDRVCPPLVFMPHKTSPSGTVPIMFLLHHLHCWFSRLSCIPNTIAPPLSVFIHRPPSSRLLLMKHGRVFPLPSPWHVRTISVDFFLIILIQCSTGSLRGHFWIYPFVLLTLSNATIIFAVCILLFSLVVNVQVSDQLIQVFKMFCMWWL